MDNVQTGKLRNVCLLGHGRTGKTTLAEAMLYKSGATEACGSVENGTSVSDYDPEEIKRKFSINTSVMPLEWKGVKINLIDTPGYFDFAGAVCEGVRAADAAIIAVSGKSGVAVGTELAFRRVKEKKIPCIFYVNKLDDEKSDYFKVLEQLKETFGKSVAPFSVPVKDGDHFNGFISIVEQKLRTFDGNQAVDSDISEEEKAEIAPIRDMILEAVAETDEVLMEKYFNGEEFTQQEISHALREGVETGDILPVLCGSAQLKIGVLDLLDSIVSYFPSPEEMPAEEAILIDEAGNEDSVSLEGESELCALVFKTISDPYVGKISIFRVYSGTMTPDSVVYNASKNCNEKIGKLFFLRGKKQLEAKQICAGDIGATAKLMNTVTGDTLCGAKKHFILDRVAYPTPNLSFAVYAKKKGEEEKINSGLQKINEEDPSFRLESNAETHEQLINGLGEQHLDIIMSKLKGRYGVDVEFTEPIVPYRETIRKKVKVEGKHKKQSGGHGQYGHVWIEFEPGDQESLTFEEKIFGGSVPKNYFPAVEKGLLECCEHGVLAGYPVVNLKATLVDGSYHPVDSSEMAFKVAASIAFKEGLKQASPILLEPIGELKVTVPESMMGDVIGDINKRRGRILGMNPSGDGTGVVEAEVPLSQMFKYATDLRSMTQGRGEFTFEFVRYEPAAESVCQDVIEAAKKRRESEEK